MNEKFIADRITQLRMERDLSESKMAYDLGHGRSYINNITRGFNLLSMSSFLEMCEYFNVTPAEFFLPALEKMNAKTIHKYLKLDDKNRKLINEIMDAFLAEQTLEEQTKASKK